MNKEDILMKLKNHELTPDSAYKLLLNLFESKTMYFQYMWSEILEEDFKGNYNEILLINIDKNSFVPQSLMNQGKEIRFLNLSDIFLVNEDTIYIDYSKFEHYDRLFQVFAEQNFIPSRVLFFCDEMPKYDNNEELNNYIQKYVYSLFLFTKALLVNKIFNIDLIYCFNNDNSNIICESLGGMFRSLREENQNFRFSTFQYSCSLLDILPKLLSISVMNEIEMKYLDGNFISKKIKRVNLNEESQNIFKSNGVYIITGGLGGLGKIICEILAREYSANVILTGRKDLDENIDNQISLLKQESSSIEYKKVDISIKVDVFNLIEYSIEKYKKIDGIFHCAGINRDSTIINKSLNDFVEVISPKVFGTIFLFEAIRKHNVDFVVLFSSLSAAGNAGQCDYSFANCFLDNLALNSQYLNLSRSDTKVISINWPLWKDGGMTISKEMETSLYIKKGVKSISKIDGVEALKKCINSEFNQLFVIQGNKIKIEKMFNKNEKRIDNTINIKNTSNDYDNRLRIKVQNEIIEIVSQILKIDVKDLSVDIELSEYGFDSVSYIGFANKISESFSLDISPSVFYEYTNITTLVEYILSKNNKSLSKTVNDPILNIDVNERINKQVEESLRNELVTLISGVMKIDEKEIDINADLGDYGYDSINYMVLSNEINKLYSIETSPTLFYEHNSINRIANYLYLSRKNWDEEKNKIDIQSNEVNYHQNSKSKVNNFKITTNKLTQEINSNVDNKENEPIAIIGMSGRFPGANNLNHFWQNLLESKNCISEIPMYRWKWENYYGDPLYNEGKTKIKYGGFIEDADKFDHDFFNISLREAEVMDPVQRIFLEVAWSTLEDAGYKTSTLNGKRVGVFVGVGSSGYLDLIERETYGCDSYASTGNIISVLPNRLSYLLNLTGPSEIIDTACSSSLVAVHRAILSIRNGECESALVGGAGLLMTPRWFISFDKAGMLSEDGKCKTFDKSANGYVRGEGIGVIYIKPLEKAKKDGDIIHAVIKGASVNHAGKSQSLTAPNPNAQADLIVETWRKANVDPQTITYIEAHGTGTALGDPIEIDGLKKAYKILTQTLENKVSDKRCGIGSVKTNIGHLETAAGLAGLIKVVLSIKNKKLPPILHFKTLNPYINFENSPFYIIDKLKSWENQVDKNGNTVPLRAGISSFGFGGVNSHLVIEEYIEHSAEHVSNLENHIFILSAKNYERLHIYATIILDYLENNKYTPTTVAYTLQTGRDDMSIRMAFLFKNQEELNDKLKDFINKVDNSLIFTSEIKKSDNKGFNNDSNKELMIDYFREKNYEQIMFLWLQGVIIDWEKMYDEVAVQKISLPTYPFLKKRVWINSAINSSAIIEKGKKQNNESEFNQVRSKILNIVGSILKINKTDIDLNTDLTDFGFDSIGLGELLNKLNIFYGAKLTTSFFIENSTINKIIKYLNTFIIGDSKTEIGSNFSENYQLEIIGYNNSEKKDDCFTLSWTNINLNTTGELSGIINEYKRLRLLVEINSSLKIEVLISGSGTPVLLIPGLGLLGGSLGYMMEQLSNDFLVIAIHNPGHGNSGRVNFTSHKLIADIYNSVITKLGIKEKISVVGTSLGGLLAMIYAIKYPSSIENLIIVSSPYRGISLNYTGATTLEERIDEDFKNITHSNESYNKGAKNLDVLKKILINNTMIDPMMAAEYSEKFLMCEEIIENDLPLITAPSLIIHGKLDSTVAFDDGLFLSNNIKGSKFIEIAEGGHFILLTHQEKLTELITNFIKDNKKK